MAAGSPRFWESFAASLLRSSRERAFLAFIPWWLILTTFSPSFIYHFQPFTWSICIKSDQLIQVQSALLVLMGFLGALSISAMSQVFSISSSYPFSAYLKEEDLFDEIIFWPQFVLLIQISCIFMIMACIVLTSLYDNLDIRAYTLLTTCGISVYAITKTWNLVDLIRQISWHYEEYVRLYNEAERDDPHSAETDN